MKVYLINIWGFNRLRYLTKCTLTSIKSIAKISSITSYVLFRTEATMKLINSKICVAIYNPLSNIVLILVLYDEVLTGFKNNFKKQLPKVFYKKVVLQKFCNIHKKTLVLTSLFNKFAGWQAGSLLTKRLQDRCFHVDIAKFLKTSILKDICERLLLNFVDLKWN